MTAAECAEWLLNSEEGEKKVHVRKNTLPAYAAHALMMRRADLFVADPGDMRETGNFWFLQGSASDIGWVDRRRRLEVAVYRQSWMPVARCDGL
ncbi:MAG: hypothetical protein EOO38_17575 [Cytophagaceae bacterium]|nr:MAG: hypothetical protein EOO38_17575 [Cytophagaceae bacterium]